METCPLPHPKYNTQWPENQFWSYIKGNLGGEWIFIMINEILAAFGVRTECDMLCATF
jgi:hypothetical protein